MDFAKYKTLARQVYGHALPENFESLPDDVTTYKLVASLPEPTVHGFAQCTDLFSVSNMTGTQLYNIKLTGKSQWKGDRK